VHYSDQVTLARHGEHTRPTPHHGTTIDVIAQATRRPQWCTERL